MRNKWFVKPSVAKSMGIVVGFCVMLAIIMIVIKHESRKAYACGSYLINGSTTQVSYTNVFPNMIISFSLWYDSCTSSNFTSANVIQGSEPTGSYVACIDRNPGLDGGHIEKCNFNCSATGTCNSPEVYSPNNTAYSRIFDVNFDTSTSSF